MRASVARHPLASFIVIAFGWSWTLWFVQPALSASYPDTGAIIDALATFGPAVGALVVAAVLGRSELRRLRDAFFRRQPGPGWFVLALVLFPAISALGLALITLVGLDVELPERSGSPVELLGQSVLVFATTAVIGGPLGEEFGWRGTMLPHLQRRASPLLASLLVGLAWGAWHLPLHVRGLYDESMGDGILGFGLRLLSSTSLAVLFTWFFNRTSGSLLIAVLLHTSVNNTTGYWLPVHPGVQLVLIPVLIALVIVDRMWRRPGTFDPVDRVSAPLESTHDLRNDRTPDDPQAQPG